MDLQIMSEPDAFETRREGLLEAAVSVFARYGYRKTSMDEVARAAGVSRQGLYLHFADKEALFRKAVEYKLARQLSDALLALSNPQQDLETRLIAACDAWAGRSVGTSPADVATVLHATARGLKHSSQSRSEFIRGMTAAARLFCAPLRPAPQQE
jgi:TetR/AcrR family transcriptional regulator of autoinduction and epiphytic fitness